jgi:DNA-3-methyladenine glycosylase
MAKEQGSRGDMAAIVPSRILPQSFYARDALVVARDLLGKLLRRDEVVLRITEVEAYRHPNDTANHCRMGRTIRNAPMWGPAGHAYVYLCYGIHHMLNVVTDREDEGAAVLVRACEPVGRAGAGRATTRRDATRRSGRRPALLTGPGKVGQALGLDTSWSGHPLFERGRADPARRAGGDGDSGGAAGRHRLRGPGGPGGAVAAGGRRFAVGQRARGAPARVECRP